MLIRASLSIGCILTSLVFVACDRASDKQTTRSNPTNSVPVSGQTQGKTTRNPSERNTSTGTRGEQPARDAGVKITADIRRLLMDDKSMSLPAQSWTISTDNVGVVSLRGQVASQAEKDAVGEKVRSVTGVSSVVNELVVK
ncbi:MAG TPA: BON domain-containing protein [Phycisphaerales bacterium]|nr:BON domain-containing protein [Phycisphaerales bacterium]